MNHKTAMIEAVWGIKKAAFKAAFFISCMTII